MARALLKKGAKHDRGDKLLRTPLSYAASKDAIEVVELLLCIPGSNPDTPDKYLRTPLSYAAAYGHRMVVRALLEHKDVNVHAIDNYYITAMGDPGIMQLLHDREIAKHGSSSGKRSRRSISPQSRKRPRVD